MPRRLSLTLPDIAYNSCASHLGYDPNTETKPEFMQRKLKEYYYSMHETKLVKSNLESGRDAGKAQARDDMLDTITTDEEVV